MLMKDHFRDAAADGRFRAHNDPFWLLTHGNVFPTDQRRDPQQEPAIVRRDLNISSETVEVSRVKAYAVLRDGVERSTGTIDVFEHNVPLIA